jgi:uncharacterized repeat protein (TIGR01451 family)
MPADRSVPLLERLDAREVLAADLAVTIANTLPAFVVPGDKLTLTATVTNRGDAPMSGPVTVNFLAPGLTGDSPVGVVASLTKSISLAPGKSTVLSTKWTANDAALPADYAFGASLTPSAFTGDVSNDVSTIAGGFHLKYLFGTYGGRKNVVLTTTDDDGTLITFSLKGNGYAEFRAAEFDNQQAGLDLVGTDRSSALSIALKGGDGKAAFQNAINIAGSLGKFDAKGSSFSGSISVAGTLSDFTAADLTDLDMTIAGVGPAMKFKASDATNLRLTTATPIASMDLNSWQWLTDPSNPLLTESQLSTLNAPWLGKLTTKGDYSNITSITGVGAPAFAVSGVKIGGAFSGQFSTVGGIAAFAAASIDSGMVLSSGVIGSITTATATDASAWARSILKLDLGRVASLDVATGCTFDATALPSLAQGNSAVLTWGAGSIGSISVKGNLDYGRFASGLNPMNGVVLDADDQRAGAGVIGKIEIKGSVNDLYVAGTTLPLSAKIGAATVLTTTDDRFLWIDGVPTVGRR